jgi:regulator of nonsense transcripts 2
MGFHCFFYKSDLCSTSLQRLDERSLALINSAMYIVKPPASGSKRKAKQYSPLEGYIRYLLMVELEATEESVLIVSKQLLRCPWYDPSEQVGPLICKIMMKACRAGRYKTIQAVAEVAAKMRRRRPEISVLLLDSVLEELRWSMEHPAFKDQQRTLTMARLLGELQCAHLASVPLITQQLFMFINLGHEIPPALRQGSAEAAFGGGNGNEASLPVLKSTHGVSQSIAEDEEMGEEELQGIEETQEEVKPVAVSPSSKYDPRVPSPLDPPNSVFRIKLVCTLLEVFAPTLDIKNNVLKLGDFLTAFQRYLFTKATLPAEVEFALLDTFDLVDSIWRNSRDDKKGFTRFLSWLEAHKATVANEEREALLEKRQHDRMVALSGDGDVSEEVVTIASDLLNDEGDMLEDTDDEDSDSNDEDGMSLSVKDSIADESTVEHGQDDHGEHGDEDDEMENGSVDDDASDYGEDNDDDDSDDSESEESDDEFDEEAHMRQLEDEAFDAELRRLTMDALEKGKVASRSKVADTMVSGSQFIKKKQNDTTEHTGPMFALGGKEGISLQLLKKGNKGKMEAKPFLVPKDVNLAMIATKQDDKAAREKEAIKARVLQYEAESAESEFAGAGGNVYLEQEKIQVIKNRLSMDRIDQNFGTTGGNLVKPLSKKGPSPPNQVPGSAGGRGRGYSAGRGGGYGGRGRGRTSSGRGLV